MTLEEMLAREAIRHTMAVYNTCGDRGANAEAVTAFAEEGVLEVPNGITYQGRQAVLDFFNGLVRDGTLSGKRPRPTRHHLSTSRIEIELPDRARSWTYFTLVRDGAIIQNGIYVDQFVRVGERWLIAHRRVKIEYDAS